MSLHRQVAGRTPLLNDVLESVETRSAAIRKDLRAFSKKNEADSRYVEQSVYSAKKGLLTKPQRTSGPVDLCVPTRCRSALRVYRGGSLYECPASRR